MASQEGDILAMVQIGNGTLDLELLLGDDILGSWEVKDLLNQST